MWSSSTRNTILFFPSIRTFQYPARFPLRGSGFPIHSYPFLSISVKSRIRQHLSMHALLRCFFQSSFYIAFHFIIHAQTDLCHICHSFLRLHCKAFLYYMQLFLYASAAGDVPKMYMSHEFDDFACEASSNSSNSPNSWVSWLMCEFQQHNGT